MEYYTIGREHNAGKIALAKVVAEDPLDDIKDKCYFTDKSFERYTKAMTCWILSL